MVLSIASATRVPIDSVWGGGEISEQAALTATPLSSLTKTDFSGPIKSRRRDYLNILQSRTTDNTFPSPVATRFKKGNENINFLIY